MAKKAQALVYWTREDKVSIEPMTAVPESSRFEGSVGPVMFRDRRFYPGRVMMITDDTGALNKRLGELELEIASRQKAAAAAPSKRRAGQRKAPVTSASASERAVAQALGQRAPPPPHLRRQLQIAKKARKDDSEALCRSQRSADKKLLPRIQRSLLPSFDNNVLEPVATLKIPEKVPELPSDDDDDTDDGGEDGEDEGDDKDSADVEGWCSSSGCKPCSVLQTYNNPLFLAFIRDLSSLFDVKNDTVRYLELLPLDENVKKVELGSSGSGVFLSESERDQLKVDYRNKPGRLARETIFALYGKSTFQKVRVTGRGNVPGSYAIPDHVLKVVVGFVNKYVKDDKRMTVRRLVTMINKRSPEWRKNSPKPRSKTERKKLATSGSHATPLKSLQLESERQLPREESLTNAGLASTTEASADACFSEKAITHSMSSPGHSAPSHSPSRQSGPSHMPLSDSVSSHSPHIDPVPSHTPVRQSVPSHAPQSYSVPSHISSFSAPGPSYCAPNSVWPMEWETEDQSSSYYNLDAHSLHHYY